MEPAKLLPDAIVILPAAGHSRRMGRPKLQLPWRDSTVIEQVLDRWKASKVTRIVVTVRPDDKWLAGICHRMGVELVIPPNDPADMKESVCLAIEYVQAVSRPPEDSIWLLAPADMPTLAPTTIDQVIEAAHERPGSIVLPRFDGRKGHPVSIPWRYVSELRTLGPDEGVNCLVNRHATFFVEVADPGCVQDVDTPQQYRQQKLDDERQDFEA